MTITSRQNPIVARYRAAARGDDASLMLLDGAHLVADALAAGIRLGEVVVASGAESRDEIARLLEALARSRVPVVTASSAVMAALSPVRSSSPIVALAPRPPSDSLRIAAATTPLLAIAADVQDPGNLGAIVRVAEAAGADGVIVAGASADPFGWKTLRGSMGSALRLPMARARDVDDAVAEARHQRCRIVATVPRGGRSCFEANYVEPVAVLIGGEGPGLPQRAIDAADERVTIPMEGRVESLNAAVTAAIVLYEAHRQRAHDSHEHTKDTKTKS